MYCIKPDQLQNHVKWKRIARENLRLLACIISHHNQKKKKIDIKGNKKMWDLISKEEVADYILDRVCELWEDISWIQKKI